MVYTNTIVVCTSVEGPVRCLAGQLGSTTVDYVSSAMSPAFSSTGIKYTQHPTVCTSTVLLPCLFTRLIANSQTNVRPYTSSLRVFSVSYTRVAIRCADMR